ncbi:hypothetical protein BJH93_15435 [Kocuria polaris]|nr:hypothetical protein [Kocuria polaris]
MHNQHRAKEPETMAASNKKAAADAEKMAKKIASMEPADRAMAERIHDIVTEAAPDLAPKLWYGQPAWYRDGAALCFFRSGHDDKERYSTFGIGATAALDEPGGLWPTSWAITEITDESAETIRALVARAAA